MIRFVWMSMNEVLSLEWGNVPVATPLSNVTPPPLQCLIFIGPLSGVGFYEFLLHPWSNVNGPRPVQFLWRKPLLLWITGPVSFWDRFSHGSWNSLASKPQGLPLSLPLRCWDYRHNIATLAIDIGVGCMSSGPHTCSARLSHHPGPKNLNNSGLITM